MKGYTPRGMWCSDFQYGFRFSRSNVNLLTVASDRSARAFNMYGAIRFVAFDGVSKAFDKVCHAALLYKRKSSEFWVRCLGLIFSFLSNRRLPVVLVWKYWQEYQVYAGCFSILGSTLFLLYINDLPDNDVSDVTFHGDDTTPYSNCNWATDTR